MFHIKLNFEININLSKMLISINILKYFTFKVQTFINYRNVHLFQEDNYLSHSVQYYLKR